MSRTEFTGGDGLEFIKSPFHERGGQGVGVYTAQINAGHPGGPISGQIALLRELLKTAKLPLRQGTNFYNYNTASDSLSFSNFIEGSIQPPTNSAAFVTVLSGNQQGGPLRIHRRKIRWGLSPVSETTTLPNFFPLAQRSRPVCIYDVATAQNTQGGQPGSVSSCYQPSEGGVLNQPASAVVGRMILFNEVDMLPPIATEQNVFLIGLGTNINVQRFFSTKHYPDESLDISNSLPCCNLA
jgi:hypothetical protein